MTVTPRDGFTGNVAVSVATSPATGLTATLGAPTVAIGAGAGSVPLTFTARTGGKYAVTITASQGALVHQATLTVTVNDFVMTVSPATATVVRGNKVRYTLKLTPRGAFNAPVKLSLAGLPARDSVTYVHNPAAATSSQVVTITTSIKDARGSRFAAVHRGERGAAPHGHRGPDRPIGTNSPLRRREMIDIWGQFAFPLPPLHVRRSGSRFSPTVPR